VKLFTLLIALAAALSAQQPTIENAKPEARAFSGTLATELTRIGATRRQVLVERKQR
jgi:hypothetical protein